MNRSPLLLLAPGLVACAATSAPTTPRTPAPALDPTLQTLAFYVGSWRCHGTSFARADQPEKTWDATLEVAPELGGKWLSVQMNGPGMSRTIEHKGYDPEKKKWIHLAVVNDGSWSLLTSDGWTGPQMVFRFEGEDEKALATFTKLGERSYSHAVTVETDRGSQKVWEKVCSKV